MNTVPSYKSKPKVIVQRSETKTMQKKKKKGPKDNRSVTTSYMIVDLAA